MDGKFPSYNNALSWQGNVSLPTAPGVYAIFLRTATDLPQDWRDDLSCEDRLLYIGKAGGGLKARLKTHFTGKSISDTFRRSIGAILHCSGYHDLEPWLPRPCKKPTLYVFKNESVLSKWIQQNCDFNFLPIEKAQVEAKETELIEKYYPPINILNNPRKLQKLEEIRRECALVARQNA